MELALVFLLVVTTVFGCGVPSYPANTSRVVNGEEAQPYSWPWQVSLESFFPTCGGTLIAPTWVLTAAHCITFHTYRVVLAEHDMNKDEGPEQFIMVEKMFIHPKWNDNCVSCGNDIALLKLEKSAVIDDKVQVACLPQHGAALAHNQPCYVTGWGRLYSGAPGQLLYSRPYFLWWITACVVKVTGGVAQQRQQWSVPEEKASQHATGPVSCINFQGDSGGPLNCKGRDGRWYVEGVTSFVDGRGCNSPRKPTIFTRVASFIPWISETMAKN